MTNFVFVFAELLVDRIGGELGNHDETLAYRARLNGKPSAVILEAIAPDGYSGDIKLLIAIKTDGEIAGVRVVTPMLASQARCAL